MSMRVPEEFIALLRQKIDIADVISEYVRLKRAGRSLVGLCPFHSEKTPSFNVSPGKGFYYCFGCGAGGTVINFLMEIEQITFVQALEKLAQRAGLAMPAIEDGVQATAQTKWRMDLLAAHELAVKFYNHILMNHDAGMQGVSYFLHRGLTKKTIGQFNLGFAPKTGRALVDFLLRRGVSSEVILAGGLGVVTDFGELRDRFRGRVMFPICDTQGRPVGFGARTLGQDEPKYLNTQETPLFQKGHVMFAYHKARQSIRKSGQALLVEGYMDVIALHQQGVTNAVAALGTALTSEQAGLLRRVAEEVILVYDGDAAGQKATLKSIGILRDMDISTRIARMPEGMDPDEWISDRDAAAFRTEVLDHAVSGLTFQLLHLTHEHPDHLTHGRIEYLRAAIGVVAKESSSIEREAALEWLGKTYSISISALRDDLQAQLRQQEKRESMDKNANSRNTVSQASSRASLSASANLPPKHEVAARELLTYMLIDAGVAKQVQVNLNAEFSVPIHSALQAYLYMFYADHDDADPELLLSYIDDPQVVQFAASLLHEATERIDPSAHIGDGLIHDYIDCLIGFGVEQEIARVAESMKEAHIRGDYEQMRALELELRRLQQRLRENKFQNPGVKLLSNERRSGR